MENKEQRENNLSMPIKNNLTTESSNKTQNVIPQNITANLDQKRNELLSSNKIDDEVSGYLRQLVADSSLVGNIARPQEEKKNLKQSIVRTFKSDAEEAIKTERMSSASIAIAEEKKKQKYEPFNPTDNVPKSKKILIFTISLLFVFGGIGAFNFNYIKEKINFGPEPKKALEIPSLITADSNLEFNLSNLGKKDASDSLYETVRTTDIKYGLMQNIYITKNIIENEKEIKKIIGSKEFMQLISSKIPDILFRSLSSKYMLGTHSLNSNYPFIILKTDSYENAFAGMLSWEKDMAGDLIALFPRKLPLSMQEGTTTTEQILAYKKEFEDVLVKNRDTRALKDESGNTFLTYSMIDKETIIITSNTDTLTELFNRILRSRAIR